MKYLIIFLFFTSCSSNKENTHLSINDTLINVGKHKIHETKTALFYVKNAGKNPLKIIEVNKDCSCITTEWTKEDIPPLDSAVIKVTYNNIIPGKYQQMIHIKTNTESKNILILRGEIIQ